MRVVTIRAGTWMYPRDKAASRPERARHDHDVLAIPTSCPGRVPGWSFRRGPKAVASYWYVLGWTVDPVNDVKELSKA
jgi:hypothetical protein